MFQQARRGRRRAAAVAAVVLAALTAAGCAGGSGSGGRDDTLVVYTGQSSDYQVNFNPFSPNLIEGPGTIFEPLFFYNVVRNDPPAPRLGTAYSWNATGTELDITVRDNATWSDGVKFTAADVVYTLDLISKNKALNTTGYAGQARAVDDTHVAVTFPEPSFMQGPQVLGRIFIVPQHLWKDIANPVTDPVKNPVGTGPYQLDDFKPQAFTLKANPHYWGGEPAVKKIRAVSLSGNQAGADALAAGTIDWQTGPVPDIKDIEKNYPGYKAAITPLNQVALFTCSNAQLGCTGPQTDPAVRKAIYYALNRTQLNSLAFENTSTPISPGFALIGRDDKLISGKLHDRTAPMSPDTAKAAQVLAEAGYTKGADGVYARNGTPLALSVKVVAGWTDYITAVDTMAQQLQRFGIKLTAEQLSWNEWSDARGRGQYQLLIDSLYQGPAPDPFYLYSYFFSSKNTAPAGQVANPNFGRFSDPAVDAALAALDKIDGKDTAARQPYLDTVQTRIEEVMPYIPVLTGSAISEFNAAKFTGFPTKDDVYAFPAVWGRPDASQIYIHLKPAG
ncbi:ABC transporter substrate-binding protein [Kutzneria kofuensis]|nr:ABC transporter substrate-binding protein [Kutzneria kofuensis]